MTNVEFSRTRAFIGVCEKANIVATPRQASKYRRKTGAAYLVTKNIRPDVHIPDVAKLIK